MDGIETKRTIIDIKVDNHGDSGSLAPWTKSPFFHFRIVQFRRHLFILHVFILHLKIINTLEMSAKLDDPGMKSGLFVQRANLALSP